MDLHDKEVFTTGQVAEICQISQQTVIRCFDNGRLKGFRVPGSRFRRVPRDSLLQFMKDNGIPLARLQRGKRRVLVVDDDPDIVEMLTDLLQADGRFEVKTASTGYDAGLLTRQFNPDIMILDYLLPDINGNVVLAAVRKDPELAHMKIILVSGVVNQEEVDALLAAGANEFIKKPFDIDHLIARVAELVGA
jgi:excisionase family DNA binding protein